MANKKSLKLVKASSQYVYVADNADVSITGDITIECWINLTQKASDAGAHYHLVNTWTDEGSERAYALYLRNNDRLRFLASDDGSTDANHLFQAECTDNDMTTINTWIHVAVTFDISAETCKFYVDGVLKTTNVISSPIGATMNNSNSNFLIGAQTAAGPTVGSFLDGKIDEVRLWNVVRTPNDIANFKDRELVGDDKTANLKGYWKFNGDYTDSAKSSDLTSSGSPTFSGNLPFIGGSAMKAGTNIWG